MAREEVAAGEGALRTWRIRLPSSPSPWVKTKSSISWPSASIAWALTPVGPLGILGEEGRLVGDTTERVCLTNFKLRTISGQQLTLKCEH